MLRYYFFRLLVKFKTFISYKYATFYSQQGEDLFVFKNFINKKVDDGIYLEIGAYDGITYSNTLFFEENLNFRGILIEPIKTVFKKLEKNRPKNHLLNIGIDYAEGESYFLGENPASGFLDTLPKEHLKNYHDGNIEYKVITSPISKIVNHKKYPYIDYFIIDVEGAELKVLETFDWKIELFLICIELDGLNEEKDEKCRGVLKKQGLNYITRVCGNEFWINKEYYRKEILYKKKKRNFSESFGNHVWREKHLDRQIKMALKKDYTLD